MRKTLLILGALALAALLFVIRVSDKQRASSSLEAAYTARAAGELCFSSVAAGWEVAQWAGVGLYKDGPDFQEWARVAEIVDVQTNTPMLFGKSRVLTLNIAAKQYADLARKPTGTWVTYPQQMADLRSRLDAAILAVESEDAGATGVDSARGAVKAALLRAETTLSDAKDKAKEDKRLADEKEKQEESERVRKLETAQTLREAEAQQGRERMRALGAASTPYTAPAPTPLAIDFSRPKPTPMLGRK
jgi:type II secretory pathway pseudopilin PulG